jgi:nucleotide-binding universal stress UspA family protein
MNTQLRTIVAGIATLHPDDPALAGAVRLAERTGATLHLVHVHGPDAHDSRFGHSRVKHNAGGGPRETLKANARALSAYGDVVAVAVPGVAGEMLAYYAAEAKADLLVLGAARRSGMSGAVLGTTAPRVLRASTVPVFVMHDADAWTAPRRVLLPTDLSEHSASVLPVAVRLAAALAAPASPEFRPLFVEVPTLDPETAEMADARRAFAETELAGFLAAVPGLQGTPGMVRGGLPSAQVLAAAHEYAADLVILGTHGRRGIARLFLGSVAEQVLRHAPCNALVIPPLPAARLAEPWRDAVAAVPVAAAC